MPAGEPTGDEPAPTDLARHHSALTLFVEAIAGRPVAIEASDEPIWPDRPLGVRDVVELPSELPDTGEAARRRYRAIAHFQAVALRQHHGVEIDQRSLADRHPALPHVFAVLEDHRVGRLARLRYPGGAAELDRIERRARRSSPLSDGAPIVQRLRERALGDAPDAGDPPIVADALRAVTSPDATIGIVMQTAVAFCDAIDRRVRTVALIDDDEQTDPETEVSGGGSSGADDGAIEAQRQDGLAGGRPIDPDDAPLDVAGTADDNDDERDDDALSLVVARSDAVGRAAAPRVHLYDEWDFRAARHRRAWCRLVERRVHGDASDFIADVRRRHADLRAEIRRGLEQLRPERLVRVHRSVDGDELDLDAVIVARADRRAGAPVDDRLRIRRDRAARDVATVFLVDLSASTSSAIEPAPAPVAEPDGVDDDMLAPLWVLPPENPEPPRRVIDVAKDAVALMSDALDELGDRHAVHGFSGTGRLDVDYVVAKDFGDPVTPATWAAIDAMRPLRYTRMGPAIRHATRRLVAEAAATRLLVVVSDGYPQDIDYGDDARDRDYGLADTARALEDAQRSGIDTFCVTIDPAGHDYLREMCPDRRYLVIDDVETLPAELAKVWIELRSG